VTYPLAEIWFCLSLAALLGFLAGWLVWGRRTHRIVASYRGRLARLQANWETVEERLTEALERAAALERERDRRHAELERSATESEGISREKELTFRDERGSLEARLRQLDERILALEPGPGPPAQPQVTDLSRGGRSR
jgi:chromosome segregation ATPase